MSLATILLAGFFLLGLLVGPLAIAGFISALSDERGRNVGDWAFGLGLKSVWRPSMTFNAANELTLKRRSYDEKHDEQKITFGGMLSGVERFLFDPQNRLHGFFGTPFGFVDERFGIIFDVRDVVVGRELDEAQEAGVYTRRVESGESLNESVLGVFELPKPNVGVNLPNVWTLVGGSFDAQLVRKIDEFYQKSQAPKASTTALRQLLVPVGTFIAIVLLGIFAAGNGGGGGGAPAPSGNESTVNIGAMLWMLMAMPAAKYNRRDKAVIGITSLLSLGFIGLLYLAFPMWVPVFGIPLPLGVWAVIMMGIGMAILPVTAGWFGRSLGGIGMLLGKLFITIGLLGYDRPVITQVGDDEYGLREHDEEEWAVKPQFYRFALTRLGVGLVTDEDVWGDEIAFSPAQVEEMGAPLPGSATTDGGWSAPQGYAPTEVLAKDDIGAYVPEDVDSDALYVRTDLTTGWFAEAGQNRRLMKAALDTAKEKHGGGQKPVSDKWIMAATLVAMFMGAVFDWLVFF